MKQEKKPRVLSCGVRSAVGLWMALALWLSGDCASAMQNEVLCGDLVAYYPFEGSFADASGNGHDGAPEGAVTFAPGVVGGCLAIPNGGGRVVVPHSKDLEFGSSDFTVTLWVKFLENSNENVLIEKCSGVCGNEHWTLATRVPSGTFRSPHVNGGCASRTMPAFDFGSEFHHVAWTRAGDQWALYINGNSHESWQEAPCDLSAPDVPLTIAARNPQDGRNFDLHGYLDEIRIYRRALSLDEIRLDQSGADCSELCGEGSVVGDGVLTDVLLINGSSGGVTRSVGVDSAGRVWASMLVPPSGGAGRFVVHANLGAQGTFRHELPGGIGGTCFELVLPDAQPVGIWNNLGARGRVGHSFGFDGAQIEDPAIAPTILFQLQSAGDLFPVGSSVTLQGVVVDPASKSMKRLSVTNGVTLVVE